MSTRSKNRYTKIGPFAAAAMRPLLFTGCRLREILHLKWEHVDLERGLLFLADSETGRKTVISNAPALVLLLIRSHAQRSSRWMPRPLVQCLRIEVDNPGRSVDDHV
jgi:integrase